MKTLILKSRMFLKKDDQAYFRKLFMQQAEEGLVLLTPEFEIEAVPEEWIECSRINPEPYSNLIFCDDDGIIYSGTRDHLGRYLAHDGASITNVIAWMPAPEAFKKGEKV